LCYTLRENAWVTWLMGYHYMPSPVAVVLFVTG
jgi:hypothetical protein